MTESFCLNPSSVQSPPNKMVDRETEIWHRMCLEIKVWRWPGYHRCAMLCCAALSRLVVSTAVANEKKYIYIDINWQKVPSTMIMFGSGTWLQCNKNILNLQHLMFLKAKVVLAFITKVFIFVPWFQTQQRLACLPKAFY